MKIGRIRRSTYIITSLLIIAFNLIIFYSNYSEINSVDELSNYGIIILISFIASFFLNAGRFNDINLSGWYALLGFVPVLNIGLIALLFIDGTKGKNKYGSDPKNRINEILFEKKQHKIQDYSNYAHQIDKNLELLEDSFKEGILDSDEYEVKKRVMTQKKVDVLDKQEKEKSFLVKSQKLKKLFANNIISRTEYLSKIKALKQEIFNNGLELEDEDIDLNTMMYFTSRAKEYGPYPAKEIIELIQRKKINPNCYIRLEHENTYHKRAKELLVLIDK